MHKFVAKNFSLGDLYRWRDYLGVWGTSVWSVDGYPLHANVVGHIYDRDLFAILEYSELNPLCVKIITVKGSVTGWVRFKMENLPERINYNEAD